MNAILGLMFLAALQTDPVPGLAVYVDPAERLDPGLVPMSFVTFAIRSTDALPPSNAMELGFAWDPNMLDLLAVQPVAFALVWNTDWDYSDGTASLMGATGDPATGAEHLFDLLFLVVGTGDCVISINSGNLVEIMPVFANGDGVAYAAESVQPGFFSNVPSLEAPTGLVQRAEVGGLPQPSGFVDEDGRVTMTATLPGLPLGAVFELEIKHVDFPFDGGGPDQVVVLAGATEVSFTTAPFPDGDYKWRVRLQSGLDGRSAWVEFGNAGVDYKVARIPVVPPVGEELPGEGGSDARSCGASAGTPTACMIALLAGGLFRRIPGQVQIRGR